MKSRISKITVGRLYNLGNYEHVRYEITVDVSETASAALAIRAVEKLLAGLKPLKTQGGVKEAGELRRDGERILRMKALSDDDWQREYGHAVGTREEIIARYEKAFIEETDRRDAAVATAKTARELFDNLGGTETWKDAKLDWEDEYEY